MSTEIKPGMQGRAVRDTESEGGTTFAATTVATVTYINDTLRSNGLFVGRVKGRPTQFRLRIADFLFVPVYDDATPAPLDPSKVKAGGPFDKGDTVRRTSETPLRYAAIGIMPGRNFTVRLGTKVRNGVISVEGTRGVLDAALFELVARATAHQPAPEPEPEWKPGMFASVRILGYEQDGERYRGFFDSSGHFYFPDSEGHESAPHKDDVTDVRPLVVIDPAAVDRKALEEAFVRAGGFSSNAMGIRAVLRHLGIEATR